MYSDPAQMKCSSDFDSSKHSIFPHTKSTSIEGIKEHSGRQDCTQYLFCCFPWNWALQGTTRGTRVVTVCSGKHEQGKKLSPSLSLNSCQVKIKLLVVWVKCKVNDSAQPGKKQTKEEERVILQLRIIQLQCHLLTEVEVHIFWALMPWQKLSEELGYST